MRDKERIPICSFCKKPNSQKVSMELFGDKRLKFGHYVHKVCMLNYIAKREGVAP